MKIPALLYNLSKIAHFPAQKIPCIMLLSAFILMLPVRMQAHPLHLSVTNITYENGKLKISLKTFRDDWQIAYFHYHGKMTDLGPDDFNAGSWYNNYLKGNFFIAPAEKKQSYPMELDTVILEDDAFAAGVEAMTIELHATVPREPNSLYIYNAILTDIFPDQSNLVILGFGKRESGMKFDIRKQDAEVKLK
jgi:hypothetical protein